MNRFGAQARRRLWLAGVIAFASLAVGCTGRVNPTTAHGGSSTTPVSSPSTAASGSSAGGGGSGPLVRSRWQGSHRGEPLAAGYADGRLWIAFSGGPASAGASGATSGQLVALDARTGRPVAAVRASGHPVSLAATDSRIWLAGDSGHSRPPAYGADQVEEFDTSGGLLHRYPVSQPVAVVAAGDVAWVQAGGAHGSVRRLHAGSIGTPVTLPGPPPAGQPLVACPYGRYAAWSNPAATITTIARIDEKAPTAGPTVSFGAPTVYLACGPNQPVGLLSGDMPGLYSLTATRATRSQDITPDRFGLLTGTGTQLWMVTLGGANGSRVYIVNPTTLTAATPADRPEEASTAAANGNTLWLISSGNDRYTVTELRPRT